MDRVVRFRPSLSGKQQYWKRERRLQLMILIPMNPNPMPTLLPPLQLPPQQPSRPFVLLNHPSSVAAPWVSSVPFMTITGSFTLPNGMWTLISHCSRCSLPICRWIWQGMMPTRNTTRCWLPRGWKTLKSPFVIKEAGSTLRLAWKWRLTCPYKPFPALLPAETVTVAVGGTNNRRRRRKACVHDASKFYHGEACKKRFPW
mmetsp:Transcript_43622/g.91704  ORF Transcript_43622/g.91704 Transcript_43622/m.91704 type:complete len:201 (-) Transcript_43622:2712-3314(-)